MNNSGWMCPKCQAVFAPFMMECKYCNNTNIEHFNKKECDHVWSIISLLSNPPKRQCIKCDKIETMTINAQSNNENELDKFAKQLQIMNKPILGI